MKMTTKDQYIVADTEKGSKLNIIADQSAPSHIYKRDGSAMPFDRFKIREAVRKASVATTSESMSDNDLDQLVNSVVGGLGPRSVPTVESIQDRVENALIKAGFIETAKNYIIYRADHNKRRKSLNDLMDIYKSITFQNASANDLMRENANIDADTAMGSMLKYGSEGAKYFVDRYILPEDMEKAHNSGRIHIHDKDFYLLTETCCQIDLKKLFKNGFSTGHGYLRSPQSIQSYTALACIAIQANQNEMHGGQAIPNFDHAMAPGVTISFRKHLVHAIQNALSLLIGASHEEALAFANEYIASLNRPLSLDEITEEKNCLVVALTDRYSDQLDESSCKRITEAVFEDAYQMTDKDTYQAMQALIHNLNTMNSRAGAQVPFSSINYGTDMSAAGRMVMRNLLRATQDGLGNGETPIFPVQIFKVKEGINYNEGDPNYDLFKLAMATSAKRLFPNFSFLDAPFNLQYYKEGDDNTEVAYMGCRTRVMGNTHDPSKEVTMGRGNLSFTSINLPRIGIEAVGDIDKFYKDLDETIDLCARQLLHRFDIQARKTVRNYPFLMGQGVWLGSDRLKIDDPIREVIKHGTLSIGFIGLAETLVALIGKHHGESDEAERLGLEIVGHMRQKLDELSEQTGLNFSLLATPAEGLSGRFVRIDAKKFGILPGITDRDYYTNSFHIPVYYPISAFEKIKLEAPYHAFTNAGHISYIELDGDASNNLEAFEAVIRCMKENGVGYGSVNHPVDRDPLCGYTGVIGERCPRCGRRDGEGLTQERIDELAKLYPKMPVLRGLY